MKNPLFNIMTPLNFPVHVSEDYWNIIVSIKHPAMKGQEECVKLVLSDPDEIRESTRDSSVLLFYRKQNLRRWICAVTKNENGDGFLITAYPTDNIKEGIVIWKR